MKPFVLITKEVNRTSKNTEEFTKCIFYKLQFIDSARFMGSSKIYQMLLITLLKEFVKLNANMDMIIKMLNVWN